MNAQTLLADPALLRIEKMIAEESSLIIVVKSVQPQPRCPLCQQPSAKRHSRYLRRVADLPWRGVPVRLSLIVRRFFCANDLCRRKVFAERLPDVVAAFAHKTNRLNQTLTELAFALGGAAGARLAAKLGLAVSGDTLLRRIRSAVLPGAPSPRVAGVDDFAFRKAHRYGTLIVDLERRRPIDLLPDREAPTLAAWLRMQTGVEVVSRDRSPIYAEAIREGAPQATQVADRFHLLKNLGETVEKVLQRHHAVLRAASAAALEALRVVSVKPKHEPAAPPPTSAEQPRSAIDQQWQAHFDAVHRLRRKGRGIRRIARELGLARNTVRRYLRSETFVRGVKGRHKRTLIGRHAEYIEQRWAEGERNATVIWQEITAQGFVGHVSVVQNHVRGWREQTTVTYPVPAKGYSSRQAAILLLKDADKLGDSERAFCARACESSAEIGTIQELGKRFVRMIKERAANKFDEWLAAVERSDLSELKSWAAGLLTDESAVRAALCSEWSNGQTEGQVNRLKFLKRAMYGRAKFDLLRARVLYQ